MGDLKELREIVRRSLEDTVLTDTAVFFADKLVSMTGDGEDIFLLARAFRASGQHRRAFHLIQSRELLGTPRFLLLAAQSLIDCGDWDECLRILEKHHPEQQQQQRDSIGAALWTLRGKVNAASEKRIEARRCFESALAADPFCFDAFSRLIDLHLMSSPEEAALLTSLSARLPAPWIAAVYRAKAVSCGGGDATAMGTTAVPELATPQFALNSDKVAADASMLFARHFFKDAYDATKRLLQRDPHNLGSPLLVHLSCLFELKLTGELSYRAQKMAEEHPDKAITWYAIGCFCFLKGEMETARTHFAKATTIDKAFDAAWIAFGHTFARRNEHDQAIAAYRTAMRLFPGCHVPPMCLGTEMLLSNNISEATKFLEISMNLCPTDPVVYNELGVAAYSRAKFDDARSFFEKAMALALSLGDKGLSSDVLETIVSNYGHALRRAGLFDEAVVEFRRALGMSPSNPSILTSLAFTLQCQGKLEEAAKEYNKALSLREDSLASDLLETCLRDLFQISGK